MSGTDGSAEDSLIARYFRPLATDPGAFGLTDDTAVLDALGQDIVITTDAVVEGVHFRPDDPPDTIARKALRVNLSDLAAKAAEPAGFVLTLALREVRDEWLAAFARALGEDAASFGCPLFGGDTVSTPGPVMISVTAFGRVPSGRMVRRSGAQAGDAVFVTGTIGDAVLGLDILNGGASAKTLGNDPGARDFLVARYHIPQPRTGLAGAILAHASAAMDVSDGLAGDLAKLCVTSGISADIEIEAIPLSPAARITLTREAAWLSRLISGGDDYEVLCTVPESRLVAFADAARSAKVQVTRIGTVTGGQQSPRFLDRAGNELTLPRRSFSHF